LLVELSETSADSHRMISAGVVRRIDNVIEESKSKGK
jgi:hypothetical protein